MSWNVGDQITAAKLNSENNTPSWNFNWTDPDKKTVTEGAYNFYYHDGGGKENPIIISWEIHTSLSGFWGKWGPDCHAWIEKRTASGTRIGSRITLFQFDNKAVNITGNLTRTNAISKFGSAEGWYYIAYNLEGDVHGSGKVNLKAYGYPTNNAIGRPLRYYTSPTSSGFITGKELSADNLNSHHIGTY